MPIESEKPSGPSLPFLDRLTTKFAIAAVVFLFTLTAATAVLVQTGFRRNQFGAYSSSQSVLETQRREALVQSAGASVRRTPTPAGKRSAARPHFRKAENGGGG